LDPPHRPAAPTPTTRCGKFWGYVNTVVIESACLKLPLTRDAVGADGGLRGAEERQQLIAMLTTLVAEIDRRPADI
jgi:hypothetical protein